MSQSRDRGRLAAYAGAMESSHGWASSSEERARIEAALREPLIGRELVAVRYVEMAYGQPGWDSGAFHSVDYGVELDTSDGATVAVGWEQAGHNETLRALQSTVASRLRPGAQTSTWDLSDAWRARFAGAVTGVGTAWAKHRWGPSFGGPRWETQLDDGGESDLCLITVVLHCVDGGAAVITLGGDAADGRGSFTYLADNLAVFLSLAAAREAGVLLPGDHNALP